MTKHKVSIGIPAYNEEANIKKLLVSLLNQNETTYKLKEIIVFSDGSTDGTIEEVKKVRNKKIKLIQSRTRNGQAHGQNVIVKRFSGDILLLINADVLPKGKLFIHRLIKPIQESKNVGLTAPRIIPVKSKTYFESIINHSVHFKNSIAENWKNGSNLLLCRGTARAFSKDFARSIYWEESLSEDAFSYLHCIKQKLQFIYQPSAELYFKSPDNFNDHIKQSVRFAEGSKVLSKYFNKSFVIAENSVPKNLVLRSSMKSFLSNPVLFLSYVFILFITRLNPNKEQFMHSKWSTSRSSKALNI